MAKYFGFNRTTEELKLRKSKWKQTELICFNRTTEELKGDKTRVAIMVEKSFNRTTEELKLVNGKGSSQGLQCFNRTTEELKYIIYIFASRIISRF